MICIGKLWVRILVIYLKKQHYIFGHIWDLDIFFLCSGTCFTDLLVAFINCHRWAEFDEVWESDWLLTSSRPQTAAPWPVYLSWQTCWLALLKFICCLVLKEIKHLVTVVPDKCTFKYAVTLVWALIVIYRSLLFTLSQNKPFFTCVYDALSATPAPWGLSWSDRPSESVWFTQKAITDMLNRSGVDLHRVTRVDAYSPHGSQPAIQPVSKQASGVERI